jgi:hypothetical protein
MDVLSDVLPFYLGASALVVASCAPIMFSIEIHVGGLIEARVRQLKTPEQALAYARALGQTVKKNAGRRLYLCADHRPVVVYSQAVSDQLAALFGDMNSLLSRIAVIVAPTNATLRMQLERVVREAQNPSRRVFQIGADAETFLGEELDPRERARLKTFLA